MATPAKASQVLQNLATASSLSPFAQQLQALQQLSEFCTSQYSSVPAPPTEIPSQQLLEAHCAATSNGLQQLTLLLQQWCSSSTTSSDSTNRDDITSSTCSTSSTASAPADPSSSDPAAFQVPPELSQDPLQAVLLLTDAAHHTIDSMRQAVTLKAHWSDIMPGRFPAVPDLQDFVGSIVSSGLVSSFCDACDALSATFQHHPHLKPAPGLTQQQLSTLHQLHSIAAALFNLFFQLAAAWPRDDERNIQVDNTGLLNPTIRPIVQPAVRLCMAMLSAVCGPAAAAPPAATDPPVSAAAASAPTPTATPTATPAPTPAATAAEASSLKAALLFGYTLSNILRDFSDDYSHTDANTDAFAAALLLDTHSSDSIFQLMLALLALTAQKMHHEAGGQSVWGDGTPVDPHHLHLLQAVGLAAPPQALMDKPSATPYPYIDETQNACSVSWCLRDIINWVCMAARDRQQAQEPGCRVGESSMPLVSAKAMSLTLLELWSLVRREHDMRSSFILMTGMALLVAKASFLFEATEEQRPGMIDLLEAAWCKALPGAALSVQYRGRPLVYNGDLAVRPSFLAEQMVGEVSMHYLYVAEQLCPEQLAAFLVTNPGPAAAGIEWAFRVCGQELMEQPNPTPYNISGDDKAAIDLPLARQFVNHLLAAATDGPTSTTSSITGSTSTSTTSSDSQLPCTASTGAPDTTPAATAIADPLQRRRLHPDLAAAIATSFKDAQQLWLLLLTLNKFALAVATERPDLRSRAAATMRAISVAAAAVLRALPASSPGRGPACMLLGRCLAGMGAAAALAPDAAWARKLPGFCLPVVQLLGRELTVPGILPAALGADSSSTTSSSREARELMVQLEVQQAELEAALAASDADNSSSGGTALKPGVCEQLQAYGAAVCALLPQPGCCNEPSCMSFAGHSEALLGHHKCGGCQAAAYCSRECQQKAWLGHKPVCKAIGAAKPARPARKR